MEFRVRGFEQVKAWWSKVLGFGGCISSMGATSYGSDKQICWRVEVLGGVVRKDGDSVGVVHRRKAMHKDSRGSIETDWAPTLNPSKTLRILTFFQLL